MKSSTTMNFVDYSISAGFPSPAEGIFSKKIDLNNFIIKHPGSTFMIKVSGCSMINAGIMNGDIIVVDRSIKPVNKSIVVARLNSEFLVKYIKFQSGKIFLFSANSSYKPIKILDSDDFQVFGVVTFVIRKII